ncbi:MAG: S16 family serine protease, partial [Candidatus Methanoperedens sp.]|nr:S16 family serine protease [Candidatus Methanoperedens sp.]
IKLSALERNLSTTEASLKNETQTRQKLEKEILNLTMVSKSDYGVLAVDETDRGHVIELEVVVKEGKSNLFINVANVVVDETLQSSAQTAIHVARDVTKTSLINKDILINIKSEEPGQNLIISGGSAGAAMTLAAMAAMQGKTLRKDVLITGTINFDHTIGRIGAVRAKALAAKEKGAVLFLVPQEQKREVGEIGIEVREVKTIEDAARYAFSSS